MFRLRDAAKPPFAGPLAVQQATPWIVAIGPENGALLVGTIGQSFGQLVLDDIEDGATWTIVTA